MNASENPTSGIVSGIVCVLSAWCVMALVARCVGQRSQIGAGYEAPPVSILVVPPPTKRD